MLVTNNTMVCNPRVKQSRFDERKLYKYNVLLFYVPAILKYRRISSHSTILPQFDRCSNLSSCFPSSHPSHFLTNIYITLLYHSTHIAIALPYKYFISLSDTLPTFGSIFPLTYSPHPSPHTHLHRTPRPRTTI